MLAMDTIKAIPTGRQWTMPVAWPDTALPWTAAAGWHERLRSPIDQLIAHANSQHPAMLVAPPIPSNWYQISEHMSACGPVRATICYSIVLNGMVCQLDTMEVRPA